MLAQLRARLSRVPRRAWLIIGTALIVAAIVAAIMVIFDPLAGPFVTLDDKRPAMNHPDGAAIIHAQGSPPVKAQISVIPREAFLADEAGAEWAEARQALPASLSPLSPIYVIKMRASGEAIAEIAIPNGAEPLALLDLFGWDAEARQWVFVPSTQNPARQVVAFSPQKPISRVMAVHANPAAQAVGVIISPGGPDLGPDYGLAMPEGMSIGALGEPNGAPVAATGSTVLPVVASDGAFYAKEGYRLQAVSTMMNAIRTTDGVVIDFAPAPGLAEFAQQLADEVHSHGKRVDVVVRGVELDRYDLVALGKAADRVWLAPGNDPNLYVPNGQAQIALARVVSAIDRRKVGLWVSALSVDVVGDQATPVGLSQALAVFGDIEPIAGYNNLLAVGDNLAVRLSGAVTSMGFDPALGMNFATTTDDQGQTHTVYFASPANLSRRLEWARVYGLGAVAVTGIAHPDASPHSSDGLTGFVNQQPLGDPAAIQLEWNVTGAGDAKLNEQSGDLGLIQYLWQAAVDPGQYVINALVPGTGKDDPVSTLVVEVGQLSVADTPTPQGTPTPTSKSPTPSASASPGAPTPQPTPAPPVTGSIAAGSFELGGQVNQSIQHGTQMQYAGMKWVKYQVPYGQVDAGGAAGYIAEGHANHFNVLLSVPGPPNPSSIDYAGYTNFVAGIAAQGPDAIEIWNEMNLRYQWPLADISGANYVTNMLAPAYQAIKATNPGVMVISGAPAPTGLYGINGCGDLGCADYLFLTQMRDAGAANYLDCVGAHYNEGIIPPSQSAGDPRGDDYYTRFYGGMQNYYYSLIGKPLCFTELGYLTPEGYGSLPGSFGWAQNTTVAQQAGWLAEAAVMASQSGKVRMMIIFNVDFTHWGADPQAGYAIIRANGTCPACEALHNVQP